jgi:hypothetical protein
MSRKPVSIFCLDLGEQLFFTGDAFAIEQYLIDGWGGQEAGHRWTDGGRARMQLHLPETDAKKLILRMECAGYLANGRLKYQTVDVLVNKNKVATWKVNVDAWYEATIPCELIRNGIANITFIVSNPTSPSEVGLPGDNRKLGVCVNRLEVIESGVKSGIPRVEREKATLKPNHLNFGEKLNFWGANYAVDKYLLDGWSAQEIDRRWVSGTQADMLFHIPGIGNRDVILRSKCWGYLAKGKLKGQSVDVLVNENKVVTWTINTEDLVELEATIPNKLIKNGNAKISFLIGNPISPFEAKLSDDKRKLGLSIHSLEFEAADISKQ